MKIFEALKARKEKREETAEQAFQRLARSIAHNEKTPGVEQVEAILEAAGRDDDALQQCVDHEQYLRATREELKAMPAAREEVEAARAELDKVKQRVAELNDALKLAKTDVQPAEFRLGSAQHELGALTRTASELAREEAKHV